jgi:hypothetical protein
VKRYLALIALAACTPAWKQTPHDRMFQREPELLTERIPPRRTPSDWWDRGFQLSIRPLSRAISPGRWVSSAVGGRAARDVNDFGVVADSEWFENRISARTLTPDDVFRGALRSDGPAAGPLIVISGKLDGATPGFVVRDTAGTIFYIKLDPPASPELTTSAEVIASRLLWTAGYHVPEIHALDVEAKRFELDPRATTKDAYGRKRRLSAEAFARLLAPINTDSSGRIRVMLSRQPDGVVLGPWDYRGTEADDPNDRILHEHRRSLRALWVFSAWINNTDIRNQNSLDVFRPRGPGRGVIRHYLLDFGNSLGSAGTSEKAAVDGFEYILDWGALFSSLLQFGRRYPRWEQLRRSPFRSVGLFEASVFRADEWKPDYPNPAFQECTRDDTFWATAILARIQPDHIRAAVTAGRYHEEGATTHVIKTLLERRRKLLVHGFAGYLELDRPRAHGQTLVLDDLRALGGLPPTGGIQYTVRWNRTRRPDRELASGTLTAVQPPVPIATGELPAVSAGAQTELRIDLAAAITAARGEGGFSDDPFITVELSRATARMEVHLRVVGTKLLPVAVER